MAAGAEYAPYIAAAGALVCVGSCFVSTPNGDSPYREWTLGNIYNTFPFANWGSWPESTLVFSVGIILIVVAVILHIRP